MFAVNMFINIVINISVSLEQYFYNPNKLKEKVSINFGIGNFVGNMFINMPTNVSEANLNNNFKTLKYN